MAGRYQRLTVILLSASFVIGCGGGGTARRIERKSDSELAALQAKTAPAAPAATGKAPVAPATAAKTPEPGKAAPAAAGTPPAKAAVAGTPPAAGTPAAKAPADTPTAEAAPVVAEAKIPDVPSPDSVSIEPVPIDTPWPPEKKLEQTVLRMQKIVYAMHEYMKKEKKLMPDAIYNKSGDMALLSWRVALLPYLGHDDLYAKFNTKMPWNSPTGNNKMLTQIPPIYQCPWGTSADSTMFVLPRSPRSLFPGQEGRDPLLVTDDWSRTVALLLLEDARAVPWTKPEDFRLKAGGSPGMLGKQTGGFMAAFADGEVAWLTQAAGREKLPALFTINGGEKVSNAAVLAPEKGLDPLEKLARMGSEEVPELKSGTQFPEFESLAKGGASFSKASSEGSGSDPKEDNRAAIPSNEEFEIAKKQLKSVFKDEMDKLAKQYPEANMTKAATANMLLEKLDSVQSEPTQAYTLLFVAREQAIAAGHYSLAVKATQVLTERYQVESFKMKAETLTSSAQKCMTVYPAQRKMLKDDALWFVYKSLEMDDFKTATAMYEVIQDVVGMEGGGAGLPRIIARGRAGVAKSDTIGRGQKGAGGAAALGNAGPRSQTESLMQQVASIKKEIDDRRTAYEKVPAALETLKKNPEDPEANLVVGRYKCLVKFDWKDGGKHLMKSSNVKLAFLATWDAKPPADGKAMAELAGEYMLQANVESVLYQRGLKMRALYWYRKGEATVPGGFLKIQTEKDIKVISEKYSNEIIEEIMSLMADKKD